MAIYHFSAQMIKRSDGRSATAAAAYRAAENIVDRTTGEAFDYTRKGGVFGASILAPSEAPFWANDRSELWNQVEAVERRLDAQVAREINLAIPIELTDHDRIELVRQFVQESFVDLGMIADVCFHDFESDNPHAHIMLTTREIGPEGFGKKCRDWNEHSLMPTWRTGWSTHANRALESAGFTSRVDHRSYEAQGVDLIPTKHLGPAVTGMGRDGISTRVAEMNEQIEKTNLRFMNRQVELEVERLKVTGEIERIRKEALAEPSIVQADHSISIATLAEREAARYKNGIAATFGDLFKGKLLKENWNADFPQSLLQTLRWVDVESRAITMKSGSQIVDLGNKITLSKHEPDAVAATVEMIKAKGWKSVIVNGSDDFQVSLALALHDEGIRISLFSEFAKERYEAEVARRKAPPEPQLESASEQNPEPMPDPMTDPKFEEPPVDLRALEDRVLIALMQEPIKRARHAQRDAEVLSDYATELWSKLDGNNAPQGFAKIFQEALKDHAIIEGYSDEDLKSAQLRSHASDLPKATPEQQPEPLGLAAKLRRTCYSGSGQKPPGN
jgi:hypothetical protein